MTTTTCPGASAEVEFRRVRLHRGQFVGVTMYGQLDGKPTVVISGLGGTIAQMMPALKIAADEHGLRIYGLDMPNHGHSCKVGRFGFRIKSFFRIIVEVIERLDLGPFILIGHSMGGLMALLVANRFRDQLLHKPFLLNAPVGKAWDDKRRRCLLQPWTNWTLIAELGLSEQNVHEPKRKHDERVVRSIKNGIKDKNLTFYRRTQATVALFSVSKTAALLEKFGEVVIFQGWDDPSTPAPDATDSITVVKLLGLFHSWPRDKIEKLSQLLAPYIGVTEATPSMQATA